MGSDDFSDTVFNALADAFGRTADAYVKKSANVGQALDDSRKLAEIKSQLASRLSGNEDEFNYWLGSIGVQGQPLRADLLNAQAVFATAAAVNLGDDGMTFADKFSWLGNFTWIWPFC